MLQSYHEESKTAIDYMSICAIADSYEHSLIIDRVLYEMTGDLECAAILSRLRYWFGYSKKNGQLRAKSRHDGKVWVARKDDEWEEEACVRVKQMPRVKRQLKKLGLVEISIYKWNGNPTTHWNLNIQRFTEMYNETIQKMISKYPDEEKRDTPMEKKETPQTRNSINKHITHASSTISLRHVGPNGQNASLEKDEMGNARYIAPPLKGSAKEEYEQLGPEEKRAYELLMNVSPAHEKDKRFNQLVAIRIARYKGLTAVRKGIRVYQQRIKRGETPKKMGGYLKDIIDKGYEPEPEHANDNKKLWQRERGRFPQGSYQEHRDYVSFPRIDKELSWRMSAEVFSDQLRRIKEQLRES